MTQEEYDDICNLIYRREYSFDSYNSVTGYRIISQDAVLDRFQSAYKDKVTPQTFGAWPCPVCKQTSIELPEPSPDLIEYVNKIEYKEPPDPWFPQPKQQTIPCGECHIKPNEICDICGAKHG